MTQRKRLVLHIGTHKTGTTYIQNSLARNADQLLQAGILYPKSGQIHNAHFKLCWQLRDPQYKDTPLNSIPAWRGLIDEIRTSPAETAIVSAEEFALSVNPARLADLKLHFDVQVLCFVRSPDAFLQSFYNQFVKDFSTRETRTLTQYMAEESLHFLANRRILEPWTHVFGKAVEVLNFDQCVGRDALLNIFFQALGMQSLTNLQHPSVDILQKVSLAPDALEYLRLSNPYLRNEDGHHAFVVELVQAIKDRTQDFQTTSSGLLSLPSKRMLRARYAPDNVWVAKTFWGQDKNPFPPDDAPPPPADFDQRPQEADAKTISRIGVMIREKVLSR